MIVYFENADALSSASDTLIPNSTAVTLDNGEHYSVSSDKSYSKVVPTGVVTNVSGVSDIPYTGFFVAPLNTGSTLVVSSTDTVVSNCNQASLLCTTPGANSVGLWHSYVDTYGSTITPTEANLDSVAQAAGSIAVNISLLGDAGPHYPFAGLMLDFTNTAAGALPAAKATFDVSAYTGVTLTYSATTAFKLALEGHADSDGANWFVTMPSTAGVDTTTTVLWTSFAQPGWVSGGQVRPKPLTAMTGLKFQYDTMQSSCAFTIKSVKFNGTGPFITAPTTLATAYTKTTDALVAKWFQNFYIENSDGTQGRVAWISGTNVDPLVTVSEGIGYGMLLALIGVKSADASDPYRKKLDRMWAFYQANVDNHGLMNWKTSGFGLFGAAASTIGSGAAPDADMDVCKALILAYEKFMDASYLTAARALMWRIWNYEVIYVSTSAGMKYLLAPGDSWTSYGNPSYAAKLPAMKLFAYYDDNVTHNWTQAYADNIWHLQQNQAATAATGLSLPSNWCDYNGLPVAGSSTLGFGWDACRVLIHLSETYRWFGDAAAYNYLKAVANNATLSSAISSTPTSIQLTVSPSGVFSQQWNGSAWVAANVEDYSMVGLASVLCAFTATASLAPSAAQAIVDTIVNYAPDDADYFRLAVKCFMLAEITGLACRDGADPGAGTQLAQIINIVGPDGGQGSKAQIVFPAGGGAPKYRTYSSGSWSALTDMGGGATTLAGDVTGASGTTTVAKILGNTVPANAVGALTNDGLGNLVWVPAASSTTYQVSGVSIATESKLNIVPGPNVSASLVDDVANSRATLTLSANTGAVVLNTRNTTTNSILATDYVLNFTGNADVTFSLPSATGSRRVLRFVHSGAIGTNLFVLASTNGAVLNSDVGAVITRTTAADVLWIEVTDTAANTWTITGA